MNTQKVDTVSPKTKEVLLMIGAGAFIASAMLIPCLPLAAKPFISYKREQDYKKWQKFNLPRLKWVLKRLESQKEIEVKGEQVILTEKGKRKILKFNLGNLELRKKWDGHWRIIIYDIPKHQKKESDYFRQLLKRIKCHQLQKSVYLTPYVCEDEIEYIKQLLGIGSSVKVLKVASLENEETYRKYFGI